MGRPRPNVEGGAPGVLPAAAITLLAGIVGWLWLSTGFATQNPSMPGEPVASQIERVDEQDIPAALTTMDGTSDFLAQFKDRSGGCPRPLAWVSVARWPGQPPGTIRLMSGSYFSPVFELLDVPVRVAIPYPAPYEMGHGRLVALDAGGHAIVALTPAWQVSSRDGKAMHEVTWSTAKLCKSPNG